MPNPIVITGAGSGLGAALAARLERDVLGIDVQGTAIVADLSTTEGRRAALGAVTEATDALDGLVPAAGLGPHVEDHPRIVAVNYFGVIALLDGLFPLLQRGDAPAAVVIASNSMTVDPTVDERLVELCLDGDEAGAKAHSRDLTGNATYASVKKAAAISMRRRAAEWGAAGVRINAIAPGPFDSPLLDATREHPIFGKFFGLMPIPLDRIATREEIAGVIEFLLGSGAAYVHGSIVYADGGSDAQLAPDRL